MTKTRAAHYLTSMSKALVEDAVKVLEWDRGRAATRAAAEAEVAPEG